MDMLKCIQRKAIKMIQGIEQPSRENERTGAVQHGEEKGPAKRETQRREIREWLFTI